MPNHFLVASDASVQFYGICYVLFVSVTLCCEPPENSDALCQSKHYSCISTCCSKSKYLLIPRGLLGGGASGTMAPPIFQDLVSEEVKRWSNGRFSIK